MQQHTAISTRSAAALGAHVVVAAAAESVRLAATPRRKLKLVDEFGPFRGRPFLADAPDAPVTGWPARTRSSVAFEVAAALA